MTDYSGVIWRVNYGEISEREQFRVGYVGQGSYDAYFEVAALAELISILNTVQPFAIGQIAKGVTLQALKVSAGHKTEVVIEPLSGVNPEQIMRLELGTLNDLVYALQLFQTALPSSPEADDWSFEHLYLFDKGTRKIKKKFLPESALREPLVLNPKDFGAVGDGVKDDTAAIQAALDRAFELGGGRVHLPDGAYLLSASTSFEVFGNDNAPVAATTGALIVRKGVSLTGNGRSRCKIFMARPAITMIYMVSVDGSTISGMEIANSYVKGGAGGAGHGIFTLSSSTAVIDDTINCTFEDLYIHGVASYGIGLQAGNPNNVRINDVTIENIGADGLDLKARSSSAHPPTGNSCSDIVVRNHGQRITGSNGVDVRGVWQLSNITVTDFGGDAALSYGGIRFRTKPDPSEPDTVEGTNSSLNGFYIEATAGALNAGLNGIESGSDNIHITNGVIRNCAVGLFLTGNVTGSALRNTVMSVTVIDSVTYGFRAATGVTNSLFVGCTAIDSGTAGFRNEAGFTTLSGCQSVGAGTPMSTSAGALPTEIQVGCRFANEYGINVSSAAAGRVSIEARGASTDVDIQLIPKGAGVLRYGTVTANADAPVTGYITVKDGAGVVRKLAIIA